MEKVSKRLHFSALLLCLIKVMSSACKLVHATDTLLPGQSLSGNQTILSKHGAFKLGFNCLSPPCYLDSPFGIWYINSSTCSPLLVWVPVGDLHVVNPWSWSFNLSESGNLHLTDGGLPIWSSSGMKSTYSSALAILLDNGNLIIRDQVNSSIVFWQSFDNPIGTVLPGGWLGFSKITGLNTSLVSHSSLGGYILKINASQSRGFVVQNNYSESFRYSGTFPSWMGIQEDGDSYLSFDNTDVYVKLDAEGTVSAAKLGGCGSVLWSAPDSQCGLHSCCGPNSICLVSRFHRPECECYDGTTAGCSMVPSLNCQSSGPVSFYPIYGVYKFPENPWSIELIGTRNCEALCFSDCSCTCYAFNGTCLLWYGELKNTLLLDYGSNFYPMIDQTEILYPMYVRLTNQEKSGSKIEIVLTVVGVLAAVLILTCLALLLESQKKLFMDRPVDSNSSLRIFSNAQLKKVTGSFSEKLGEGGFGCVFKGTLPGSSVVAVKKLEDIRQGEKQFRAEVQTIGMIQHINLVRLFGFCAEGSKRLLVYEYMENGSLNSHLFSKSSAKLVWELRYRIALGTARGLAYLHEECKDCIIHWDMKPDNVLLDAEFCPKIADFGMAKLLGRDFSRALTTMRGTIGYLAPEWISGLPITHKADVYSYGMMLLEIISGRRNAEKIKEGKFTYFPIFAAVKVNEGDVMCLLDSSLEGDGDVEQLTRACRIACWCIQDAEDQRPMMRQVVHMLEGVMDVEVPLIPRALLRFVGMEDCTRSTDFYTL